MAHNCASRVRLSFSGKKGDKPFFEALCDEVVKLPGVIEAEGRVLTGSLVIKHEGSCEELLHAARFAGVFDVHEEPPAPEPGAEFEAWRQILDGAVKQVGGKGASIGTMAAIAFFSMALAQAARGQMMPPAATALWYAISLLMASKSGDGPGAKPADGGE
jgi:hypothetical protein